jgi:transcriptional regulator with AbiEi antitoxin domain of type IV toxin-antitoxin system/uncharacterized protein DUF559
MDRPMLPDHPFTRFELADVGLTSWQLRSLLRARTVRRVLTGVYVDASLADSTQLRAHAAARVLTPNAVLCDRTAAWLHGVDLRWQRQRDWVPPLEAFVLRGAARVQRRQTMGGERDLAARDVMEVHGVRVTTPLRTALDLGARLGRCEALAALDALSRAYDLAHEELQRELPRYRRRRGVVQLRELVALCDARAESPGESWTRLTILDAGLPPPEPQVWVTEDGREIFRLDLAYRHARVAVEYDGEEHHGELQRAADSARRDWLRSRGWTVVVVRKDGFTDPGRVAWLRQLRQALRLVA